MAQFVVPAFMALKSRLFANNGRGACENRAWLHWHH